METANKTLPSPPKSLNWWKRAAWLNIIEVVLLLVVPATIVAPGGRFYDGWAMFWVFYYSYTPLSWTVFYQIFATSISYVLVLGIIALLLFFLNLKAIRGVGSGDVKVYRRLRKVLSGSLVLYLICLVIWPAFLWIGSAISSSFVQALPIPIGCVVFVPFVFRSKYTKKGLNMFTVKLSAEEENVAASLRKSILELGTKYTRLQINEIAEMCKVTDELKIVGVVEDMIQKEQIAAQYFKSSRAVAFDQQANTAALAKFVSDLDNQFTAWGKEGKKV
jgi:hypothetical protein